MADCVTAYPFPIGAQDAFRAPMDRLAEMRYNGIIIHEKLLAGEAAAMKRIGLLHHPKLPQTQSLAETMARESAAYGLTAWIGSTWDEVSVRAEIPNLDLLVTLGGDGSILRAARMACEQGVPVLGVNMGRLGFLAELDPHEWATALPRLATGDYWLEERMMLYAEYHRGVECRVYEALNDVVVSRVSLPRIVRL